MTGASEELLREAAFALLNICYPVVTIPVDRVDPSLNLKKPSRGLFFPSTAHVMAPSRILVPHFQ